MDPDSGVALPALTRRGFLGAVGVTAAVLALPGSADAMLLPRPAVSPTFVLRRREDLLRLAVTPYGMTINRAAGTITVDADSPYQTILGARAGRLAVDVGSQSVLEEAFDYVGTPHPTPPARSRLSGPSRVVFTIPAELELTLASILSWADHLSAVAPAAFVPDGLPIPANVIAKGYSMPRPDETSIEMPWWLIISPSGASVWTQQVSPKTLDGRTEVFNSRLAKRVGGQPPDEDDPSITVRGVWIRDRNAPAMLATGGSNPRLGDDGYPFPMIPTPEDRSAIVRLTTRTGANQPGGPAAAVHVGLALTTLGGHLKAMGTWDQPDVSSVMSWQQRIWQGRDTYAKVVRRGFLYPWGLRAYIVEEGVRIWVAGNDRRHDVRPFWFTRLRVGVTDPTLTFADVQTATGSGRRTALFRSVTCLTLLTPDLLPPATPLNQHGWSGARVFVPKVAGGTPFAFSFVGIDANGVEVPFTMPLLFAEDKPSDRQGGLRPNFTAEGSQDLRVYYSGRPDGEKMALFGGQPVGYAANADPLATSLPTTSMIFEINEVFSQDPQLRLISDDSIVLQIDGQPRNMPLLKEARTVVEDVSRIAGQQVTSTLQYPLAYARYGLQHANNDGRVFLQNAAQTATRVAMSAGQAGGVVVPKMDLAGLSSTVGAVFGTAQAITDLAADGTITPGEAFAAIELLGGVSLADILPTTFPAVSGSDPSAQALSTKTGIVDQGLPTERAVTTMSMSWAASELLPSGAALGLLDLDKATLELTLVSEVPTAGGKASWSVLGSFNDFTVSLIPVDGMEFVYVDVAKLTFSAGSGKSSSVDVDISNVRFGAALAFLAELAQYLPFGDGLTLDIDAAGIRAGLSIEIPSIGLGAFTLSGIAVNTGITLPLSDGPVRFRFGMSSTEDPFGLTVMGLGGGGWFGNDIGLDGVEYFDAAAFVQAKVALDFGVASGTVAVQMGMQYCMGLPEGGTEEVCTLTAFARIQGEVEVLGIVSIGIEVYLGLGIDLPLPIPPNPGPGDVLEITLHGTASCTVKVKLCFFTKKVKFEVSRSFKGSDLPLADYVVGILGARGARAVEPTGVTFIQAVSPDNWAQYCGAFA